MTTPEQVSKLRPPRQDVKLPILLEVKMNICAIDGCSGEAKRKYCHVHSLGRSSTTHRQICSLRRGAKIRGLPFDLLPEDVVKLIHETEFCPVFGFKLEYGSGSWNSPSIDRVDNSKGYSLDNVIVISTKANIAKGAMSKEELKMFASWINKNF
jgi:hypothetical protein